MGRGGHTSEIEHEELCVSEHGQRGRSQEPEREAIEKRVARLGMRKGRGDEGPAGRKEMRRWVSIQLRVGENQKGVQSTSAQALIAVQEVIL
jgi:hypothetical protein